MLQRAASNACSWWWVSHIRTKQSKWLDSDLQEMEERVKAMLKIVEQDGDSFAKKAEMYFKKRPELIHFVEETYKAYKALADRYDHISSELHKANHTIATAFPDQIQFDMQDDDDNLPKAITSIDPSKIRKPSSENIPPISLMNKRKDKNATLRKTRLARVASQKTIDNAQEEIDKLQKGILVLQTEKEYIKSAYDSGIAKYWDIESRITDMQEEVFSLQDEFGASVVIDDDDARALMAVTALKSCEKSIHKLQEQQEKVIEEARVEMEKIKDVKEKIGESIESEDLVEENVDEESSNDVVKEDIEIPSATSVVDLAEKINELVAKVIQLELTTSSQAAQIRNFSLEADILQKHLRSIEEEKKILADDSSSMRDRLKETEEKLEKATSGIDRSSTKGNVNDISVLYPKDQEVISLQGSEFEQYIEEKLDKKHEFDLDIKHQESVVDENISEQDIEDNAVEVDRDGKFKESMENEHNEEEEGNIVNCSNEEIAASSMLPTDWEQFDSESPSLKNASLDCLNDESNEVDFSSTQLDNHIHANNASTTQTDKDFDDRDKHEANFSSSLDDDHLLHPQNSTDSTESATPMKIDEISLNFLQTLARKTEGKEKLLLSEYTSILRNYKDTKKKLSEEEKKNQETKTKISVLQSENTMKDEEIHSLKKKLRSLQANSNSKVDNADTPVVHLPPKPKNLDAKTRRYQSFDIGNTKPLPDMVLKQPTQPVSYIEEKFRRDLDTLLEEHLEFWLRYSTSFHSIQKFQTTFEELQTEIKKVKHKRFGEGSSNSSHYNQELQPIEKKVRELKREVQVWLEQNMLLQGELKGKYSAISSVQEEISGTLEACLEASLEDDVVKFKPYQAAKFQGELLNMQNENNNVEKELKAGLEHIRGLQAEVEKTISRLHKKNDLPEPVRSSHVQFAQSSSKNKVPLKSFLFNAKPKKKQSIFACVSPALQKHSASSRPP